MTFIAQDKNKNELPTNNRGKRKVATIPKTFQETTNQANIKKD